MSLDISPTYISGDHFAPLAKPKKLLSRRRTKENWGFSAKSYGGIGVLLIGKKENAARGKGLLVSREHHHVGSGIHKFHPVPQPYQVTSLIKSACRRSDQLLPAINEADMITIARESNLLTNKPVDKFSFNPIFDVFPRFDTSQDERTMNEFLNKRKHLSAKNLEALQDITKDIYKTTSHQRDYKKHLKQNQSRQKLKNAMTQPKPPLPMPGRLETSHDVSTQSHEGNPRCVVCGCQINLTDFSEGRTDISICNYCKSTGIFKVDTRRDDVKATVTSLNLPDLRRLTGSRVCNPNAATCKPDKQNLLKPALKTRSEFTQIYASPLNYLGYYSGRHRNRLSALIRNLPQTEDDAQNMEGDPEIDIPPEKRINLKRMTIPISLKNKEFLKEKGLSCSDMFRSKDASLKKAYLKDILPMVYFPVSHETDRTTKADDEAEDDENKQDAQSAPEIIKRYRSLAYKRYHESYPDQIPDLRKSRTDAKKHFFSGYHNSVFRG